jgi:hypothetical protein
VRGVPSSLNRPLESRAFDRSNARQVLVLRLGVLMPAGHGGGGGCRPAAGTPESHFVRHVMSVKRGLKPTRCPRQQAGTKGAVVRLESRTPLDGKQRVRRVSHQRAHSGCSGGVRESLST